MSYYQNCFLDYHAFDSGKVMMKNNVVCKVIGMRNISLKLHDKTIRQVKHVRHVSNLKRNLISLGMLDQMGFSIRFKYGDLKIFDEIALVIKRIRKNEIYVLDGEVVTGESSISPKTSMDVTKL